MDLLYKLVLCAGVGHSSIVPSGFLLSPRYDSRLNGQDTVVTVLKSSPVSIHAGISCVIVFGDAELGVKVAEGGCFCRFKSDQLCVVVKLRHGMLPLLVLLALAVEDVRVDDSLNHTAHLFADVQTGLADETISGGALSVKAKIGGCMD